MNEDLIDGQWQRGQWRGREQWRCTRCQWDTLNGLAAARRHQQDCQFCRPSIPTNQPSPVLVADKRGNVKEDET